MLRIVYKLCKFWHQNKSVDHVSIFRYDVILEMSEIVLNSDHLKKIVIPSTGFADTYVVRCQNRLNS